MKLIKYVLGGCLLILMIFLIALGNSTTPTNKLPPKNTLKWYDHDKDKIITLEYHVVLVDGCEYILIQNPNGAGENIVLLTHKGNCTNIIHGLQSK